MRGVGKPNLDALGVCASTLCLVHCLAFPLLVTVATFFTADSLTATEASICGQTPLDFWIHAGLLAAVAPIGMTAWGLGYRRHRDSSILFLGVVGVGLLVTALLLGHHLMDGQGERVMTLAGSIAIVSAHVLNRRQCQCSEARMRRDTLALSHKC